MNNFQPGTFNFKTIFDASPYPIFLCIGEQMTVFYANAATLSSWGKTDVVIGMPFSEAIPELKDQPFNQLLLDVYHTGEAYFSVDKRADLIVDAKLQTFYFNFSYQPYRNQSGEIIGVFCLATDVTELVKNRERLQASEESLRLAIDAAELGTFNSDLEKGTVYWDERCRELFNISHGDALTYKDDFLPGLHIDDRQKVDQHMNDFVFVKSLSDGNLDIEYRTMSTKDSKIRWIKSRGKVFFDTNDKPIRLIGSMLDITDQRQTEMRKNEFITIASHELKTPLTTVKAHVQLLMRKVEQDGDNFITGSLISVNRQINNMITLIQSFLNNNILMEGNLDLHYEVFNVHELLKEVADDQRFIILQHDLILEDCEAVMVSADRGKIGQVIENLLSNAAKYSPNGSKIIISCKVSNGQVEIGVKDQGIGISKNDHKKLFERFYRVNSDIIKNVSGFGIGLYLVEEILRYHKSKIKIDSELGKGARFSFFLELVD